MKKKHFKGKYSDFDNDYFPQNKKVSGKDRSSKRRLSIYDDYEEDDDEFIMKEKIRGRHK